MLTARAGGSYFFCLAYLVKKTGAVFESLIAAVVTPATSIAFYIMHESNFSPYSVAGVVIVPLGILIYSWRELREMRGGGAAPVAINSAEVDPLLR